MTSEISSARQRLWIAGSGWAVAVAAIVALIVTLTTGGGPPRPVHAATPPLPSPAPPAAPTSIPPGAALGRSAPVSLRIPALGVVTPVVKEGLNGDGTLQVPPLDATGTHEAGWYDLGPSPGQVGPAVIVGHVDSTSGPAVFYRLGALVAGNKIMVTRADHSTATFAVTSVNQYPKASFPTQEVYGQVNQPDLRLITCGGTFDSATGHYLSNIVAYATVTR